MTKVRSVALLLMVIIGASGDVALGDDDEEVRLAQAQRLEVMSMRLQAFKASLIRNEEKTELTSHPQPLLRWTDPARTGTPIKDGTLWAWGMTGRPAALLTQESYGGRWAFELISASNDLVEVVTDRGWRWSPEESAFQLRKFEDSQSPADNTRVRLAQMRALARRFEIAQIGHDMTRYDLRFMPRPIHRYNDASTGLIDGAFFVYAWGTNPEAIVVIECHRARVVNTWSYGFLPITVARIEATIDGKNVWSRPSKYEARLQEPYTSFGLE
jgi:hypothetical protein